jgi:hypothetical protein
LGLWFLLFSGFGCRLLVAFSSYPSLLAFLGDVGAGLSDLGSFGLVRYFGLLASPGVYGAGPFYLCSFVLVRWFG